ncbi:MAG: hypothetical protein E4H36_03195 [Spirochaetales bacterium]|nr:MAG: hypothetical protein E4H36_03195 [Spirochaetales bacterium]
MKVHIGVKTDPVEYRYSYEWLFALMKSLSLTHVQLGSFFELYMLEDGYFRDLRKTADSFGVSIKSCFTSHRELGGFFTDNSYLEKAARSAYERLIHAASLLGADYAGSSPGFVYRDKPHLKARGIACYLSHMKELTMLAKEKGLKALTLEPMSCFAEPPSTPGELDYILGEAADWHNKNLNTSVPLLVCGDISHGYADSQKRVVHDNMDLFVHQIPHMAEFHFKNTDGIFNATFGFSPEEQKRGKVDLRELKNIIDVNETRFPAEDVAGYFETSGPKLGRDYSDRSLEAILVSSLTEIKKVFCPDPA